MARAGVDSVSQAVLRVLRKRTSGMVPETLLSEVLALNLGITDVDVKRAVWHLIARHRVALSSQQLLVPITRQALGHSSRVKKARFPLQRSR